MTHRKVERSRGLPIVARLLLIVAVVVLGGLVLVTASGGLGRAFAAIGASLSSALDSLTATPTPQASAPFMIDAPILGVPGEPYTNEPTADLEIIVPPEVVGRTDAKLRIYLALGDQAAVPVDEIAVPAQTPRVVVPVQLTKGANTFTVALVGPSGDESEPSASVRYFLDQQPPKITVIAPRPDATVNGRTVKVMGKTQGRSQLAARNEANNASVTGAAAADGTFTLELPIEAGTNGITVTSTDPAGNSGRVVLAVRRGSGKLTAALTSSVYRISRRLLPEAIELTVTVNDPDGRALEGARVTFTLSVPGIQTITADAITAGDGRASFRTTIPRGATVGQGIATVLVRTDEHGNTSDREVVTVAR